MTYETIIVETKGRVGLIRLNRPNALNALNDRSSTSLTRRSTAFEADDGIGAIVITGCDKAFAAGADIKEMQSKTYMQAYPATSSPPGTASHAAASRSSPRSPASPWAAAANSP